MRRTPALLLVLALLSGVVAFAQFSGSDPPPTTLRVLSQDGGVDVNILSSARLDVNASTAPGNFLAVAGDSTGSRLQVDVPGTVTLAGTSNVAVTNVPTVGLANGTIVNLTPATYALLAGDRECTDYPVGNVTIDGGVFTFPNVAGQQTASITIHACGASVDYVSCFRSSFQDGGPPPTCASTFTGANVPVHNGETWVVDGLADSHRLRCMACTHSGPPSGGTCLAGGAISACVPSP